MPNLVSLENIHYQIGKKSIIEDVSFAVKDSDIITIIGPNGAGKSTLLKLIIGQTKPSSGIINKKHNLKIGYVPQKILIDPVMPITVEQFTNGSDELINFLDLEHLRKRFLYKLSGGELQRALLARALIRKPDLLLLDEPSQGLDVSGILKFYSLIDKVNKETKAGIIMVSHDLNIALSRTDEIICLNKHVCCRGLPEQISTEKQFRELFGNSQFSPLGLYKHKHNHTHSSDGEIL